MVQSVEFMRGSPALDGFRINPEGAVFCLEPIGIFQRRVPVGWKQRSAREAGEVLGAEDSVFGFALGFDGAAAADVLWRHSSGSQFRTDHQKTVAGEWVFFGAHQCDRVALQFGEHPLDSLAKAEGFPAGGIVREAVGTIQLGIGWAAAQLFTEKEIADVDFPEEFLENVLIELGETSALRAAAHSNLEPPPFLELLRRFEIG